MAKNSRGGKVGSNAQINTVNDLYKLVVGSDSYVFDRDYQNAQNDAKRYFDEMNDIRDEIKELREDLKGELQVDPQLGRNLSEAMGLYTDRGLEINEKIKQLREKENLAEGKWRKAREIIGKKDATARQTQLETFRSNPPIVQYASKNSYKGFEMDTHTPYLQEKLSKGQAFIAEMSPREYLQRVAYDIFNKSSLESAVRGAVPENVKKYAKMMKKGTKFYMPSLNYDEKGQEGRHRALAALMNGYDKIPVLIVPNKR